VVIQERDRGLLRCCYEQQFLLMEQVARYFFGGGNRSASYRRIKKLESGGLLRRERHSVLGGREIIRLTRQGIELAQTLSPALVPQLGKVPLATLAHDALVASVRLRLEELWTGTWVSERALKPESFEQVPDGLFIFPSGKKVAVEVETSPKGKARLMDHLASWARKQNGERLFLVLYITPDPGIERLLRRCIEESASQVPIAVVSWPELDTNMPLAWTVKGEIDLFSRKEI